MSDRLKAILDGIRQRNGQGEAPAGKVPTGPLTPRETAERMIPKGTPVMVRPTGGGEYRPYTTTQHVRFTRYGETARKVFWVIEQGGWELRVAPSMTRLVNTPKKKTRKQSNPALPPRGKRQAKPKGKGGFGDRRNDPLLSAHARATANGKPSSGVGPVAAPGSGVDEWRDQR